MGILITGGTGFIGAEVARVLLRRGASDITVFDINDSLYRLGGVADQLTVMKGDLADFSHVRDAVRSSQAEVIYHFGAALSLPSQEAPQTAFQTNAVGTFNVLEAARTLGVPKLVFASSVGTYGLGVGPGPIDDLTMQRPQQFYGAYKVLGEHLGLCYRQKYGIDYRCVRYPAIVGPGVRTPGAVQYTSWVIEEAAKGNPFTIWVRPDTRVPLVYVKDAALAAVTLAEAPADQIKMANYLLGGPCPSAQELADIVKAKLPDAVINFEVNQSVQGVLDDSCRPIDDRFARDEWGWQPTYDLEAMVDDFLAELSLYSQA